MSQHTPQEKARVRPRFGDVIEIITPEGLAYALYTHRHVDPPRWGAVIRVIAGIFAERPPSFQELAEKPPQFITFYPLGSACARRIVRIVATVELPVDARTFPVFRSALPSQFRRDTSPWHFWDGKRSWKQDKLLPGQERLPIRQVMNHAMLIQKIVSRWRHEDAF